MMNFTRCLFVVFLSFFTACSGLKPDSGLSERARLLERCRRISGRANKKFAETDGRQVELTAAAGGSLQASEPLFYQAATFRLRETPEDTQQILQAVFNHGRQTEAIINAPREGTGSMESMQRYLRVAGLNMRQVEIFLAAPEIQALWQRIEGASGEVLGSYLCLKNGLDMLEVKLYGDETTLEARVDPEFCRTYRGADYAILAMDLPSGANSQCRNVFLLRIKNKKISIVEQLPACYVNSLSLEGSKLLLTAQDRFLEEKISLSFDLDKL